MQLKIYSSSYLWSSTLVFELHKVSQVSEDFDVFGEQIKVVFFFEEQEEVAVVGGERFVSLLSSRFFVTWIKAHSEQLL